MTPREISQLLHRRIVADLHLGRLKPGGRLPSLREVSRELGVSIRAAAHAYAHLQREGLVSVRGRSGIYLAKPFADEVPLSAPFDWYAEVLKDAWARRIPLLQLSATLQQMVVDPVSIACVESTEDHMVAFCAELEQDFAAHTMPVKLNGGDALRNGERVTLYDAIANADIVMTTAFHAAEVRAAAELLKKPVVLVSVNETLVSEVERQLAARAVTIVALDPLCVSRFRECLVERFKAWGDMRVISVDELLSDGAATIGTTTLLTRAARRRLNEEDYHLLPPPIPFLSADAARKVVRSMLDTHRRRLVQAH